MRRVGIVVFVVGWVGVWRKRRRLIKMLMRIELMGLGVNMRLVGMRAGIDDRKGQRIVVVGMRVAAVETAVGLGLMIA